MDRRGLLCGGLGLAAAQFLGGSLLLRQAAAASGRRDGTRLLGFSEVAAGTDDKVVVPPGYSFEVILPWGERLFPDAAAFKEDASNSAAEQARQVGFNHDGMHYFPLHHGPAGNRRGLLVINHEYTDARQIYSAAGGGAITPDADGLEKVAKALAAHGVSVVELRQDEEGRWSHVLDSAYNRRITGTTPMAFSGPVAAGHPWLRSAITPAPLGTLNNCAMGFTPWGTYLTCEENWNFYFGTEDPDWAPTALEARYGVRARGAGYGWHVAGPRFDLARNRNELNHFGWVVEIDPFDPDSTPVKRTALGRFKHEGATVTESRGRVCVYSGDDENGDYLYKFVGARPWRTVVAEGRSPLDEGVLHVARFEEDGSGAWLPLVFGMGPLTAENGWLDQADVLLRTRQAADALAATRLHRPEWVSENPVTQEVFVTLTKGSGHDSAVNSGRDPNHYGHIVKLREPEGDHTLASFEWAIFLFAGDGAYDPKVPGEQSVFGSPDGIWCDPDGRVWIQTDVSSSVQNRADRGHERIGNNQMLAADPHTGELRRFLVGPRGCEITGVITTPDQRTMFVNVQHPGEPTTHWNKLHGTPSVDNPSTVSSWPYGRRPRSATLVIRKQDGGIIGT